MPAHRFNTATFDRPTEALTGIDLGGRIRMKGFMILQSRSSRRDLSDPLATDASLPADASADRSVLGQSILGLSLNPGDRLTSLFGDLLDEDLLPSAAKRPAKQEDEDADEEEEDDEDEEEEEEVVEGDDEEEEEEDDEEDEEEDDDDEEEEEDEFDDPDSGFDDDDDDEEDFDDDE
jgi:hypothetical protein